MMRGGKEGAAELRILPNRSMKSMAAQVDRCYARPGRAGRDGYNQGYQLPFRRRASRPGD
jgi:hypothetical protein